MTSKELEPTIRLKMKIGEVEFEIECREDQFKDILGKILSTITEQIKEPIVMTRQELTLKGALQKLLSEEWFASPRSLSEVHNEMKRRGVHYGRGSVAHALVDLVKDGLLTRVGQTRRYRYAQKMKPSP